MKLDYEIILFIIMFQLIFLTVLIIANGEMINEPQNEPDAEILDDNSSTDNNFVFPGTCVNQPSNYCNELVENSVCNRVKDECFCRKGFVAIREGKKKLSCKSLLTDLNCRMDRDCVHVSGSMCHPGAGQCACPGKHIYVEELNACRKKTDDLSNPVCRSCKESMGMCFEFRREDRKLPQYRKYGKIGCSCGNQKVTPLTTNGKLCSAILVDIGGICNNKDLLCRSKKAICMLNTHLHQSISSCSCRSGYVAVYQRTLRYYECFPIISHSSVKECSECYRNRGYCYDINNDERGDGCLCEPGYSNIMSDPMQSLTNPCTVQHVNVQCNYHYENPASPSEKDLIRICYKPHYQHPYRSLALQLVSGRAIAYIQPSQSATQPDSQTLSYATPAVVSAHEYRLKPLNNNPSGNHGFSWIHNLPNSIKQQTSFCIVIKMTNTHILKHHFISADKVRYSTMLNVNVDALKSTPGRDMKLPVSCIGSAVGINSSNANRIPKSGENSQYVNGDIIGGSFSLDLRAIDPLTGQEMKAITKDDIIKLDASLVDSKGEYREMQIEKCLSETDVDSSQLKIDEKAITLYTKCSNASVPYHNAHHFIQWYQSSPGIHYQTSPFRLPEHYLPVAARKLLIRCQIMLCRHETLCHNYNKCPSPKSSQNLAFDSTQVILLNRTVFLSVASDKLASQNINFINSKNNQDKAVQICRYSLCLTRVQAVMTTLLMITLLLLVVVLVLILYRRHRAICYLTRKSQHQINNTNCNNKINNNNNNVNVDNFYKKLQLKYPSSNGSNLSSCNTIPYQRHHPSSKFYPYDCQQPSHQTILSYISQRTPSDLTPSIIPNNSNTNSNYLYSTIQQNHQKYHLLHPNSSISPNDDSATPNNQYSSRTIDPRLLLSSNYKEFIQATPLTYSTLNKPTARCSKQQTNPIMLNSNNQNNYGAETSLNITLGAPDIPPHKNLWNEAEDSVVEQQHHLRVSQHQLIEPFLDYCEFNQLPQHNKSHTNLNMSNDNNTNDNINNTNNVDDVLL